MAFLDKLKEMKDSAVSAANDAAAKAKETYEAQKQAHEEKKAAEAAYKEEMTAKAAKITEDIINAINDNYSDDKDGFFNGKDFNSVMTYAKDFFEKILLPANSKDKTMIAMYPYISPKLAQKSESIFGESVPYDMMIAYMKGDDGQEILLTYDKIYFKSVLPEDKKYFAKGSVPMTKVSQITLLPEGEGYALKCDDVKLAQMSIVDGKLSDFVTLNKFFEDVKNGDFEITNEEIDQVIREKVGAVTLAQLRGELDEGELLLFFTWNSSNGYVACTTEKIIITNKQSGGNVTNTSRFYYDEVHSLETRQQASDMASSASGDSLGGFLVDLAVSSALDYALDAFTKDICDLVITANGSFRTMSGMIKVEADRIVSLYNTFKKDIRKEQREERKMATQPVIIQQQQQSQPDVLEQIQKLASLKDAGILSEEEFNAKKADLLAKL